MASKTYKSLDAFVRDFPRFSKKLTTGLVVETHRLTDKEGIRLLRAEIPVVTGELRGSIRHGTTRGAKHPDEMKQPGTSQNISQHKAFHALDIGRQQSKPYSGRRGRDDRGRFTKAGGGYTRMLGLEKAPRGFTTPAVQKLTSTTRSVKIRAKAFAIAWKKATV